MRLKHGVSLKDLAPQMALAAIVVRDVYAMLDPDATCTVTSVNDSKHSESSLHYKGCALDFRTHDFRGDKQQLLHELREALGPEFDVLLEGEGTPNEHIHAELDVDYYPKG